MPGLKETEVQGKKMLKRKDEDLSKYMTPVTSWDYFDALTNSAQSVIARNHGEVSTDLDLLEKYLKMSTTVLKESLKKMQDPSMNKLPSSIFELVRLQEQTGKWTDIREVLTCLGLPLNSRIQDAQSPWEQATAFALAAIRQCVDFYPELSLVHDKAIKYFPTPELLWAARDVIAAHKYAREFAWAESMKDNISDEAAVGPGTNFEVSASNILTEEGSSIGQGSSKVEDKLDMERATDRNFETQLNNNDQWKQHIHGSFFVPTYTLAVEPKPKLMLFNDYLPSRMDAPRIKTNPSQLHPPVLSPLSTFHPRSTSGGVGSSDHLAAMPFSPNSTTGSAGLGSPSHALSRSRGGSRGGGGGSRTQRRLAELEMMEKEGVDKAIIDDIDRIKKAWNPDYRLNSRESIYNKTYDSTLMPLAPYTPQNYNTSGFDTLGLTSTFFEDLDGPDDDGNDGNEEKDNELVEEQVVSPSGGRRPKSKGKKGGKIDRIPIYENQKKAAKKAAKSDAVASPKANDVSNVVSSPLRTGLTSDFGLTQTLASSAQSPSSSLSTTTTTINSATLAFGTSSPSANAPYNNNMFVDTRTQPIDPSKFMETERTTLTSPLAEALEAVIKPKVDLVKQRESMDKLQLIYNKIIDLYLTLTKAFDDLTALLEKMIFIYNKTTTTDARNKVLDEFTARLGDGTKPIEGFYDWRGRGCEGFRPLVVEFLIQVQLMAEERLRLYEINKPEGRTLKDPGRDVELNDRWCLMWGGKDIVWSVMHMCDPFREYRELCDWYGRRFPFLGNPLMLPFNLYEAIDHIGLRQHVSDQLKCKPFLHFGFERNLSNWEFEKFLVKFRDKFLDYADENTSFNWPEAPVLPPTAVSDATFRLYTAVLVIYCRCSQSVKNTFEYEKKFVALMNTKRGRGMGLMFGEDGVKEEKFLNIPPGLLKFLEDPTFKRTIKQTKPPEPEQKKVPKPKKLKPIKLIDVLLLADVEGVGKKKKIVKVNEDYAKMYLIPRRLAEIPRKEQGSSNPTTPEKNAKRGSSKSPPNKRGDSRGTVSKPNSAAGGPGGTSNRTADESSLLLGNDNLANPAISDPNAPPGTAGIDTTSRTSTATAPDLATTTATTATTATLADKAKKAKSATAITKETLAEEVQQSRTVTRLPPVQQDQTAKMTRRLDDNKRPSSPNKK
jgi:hypothetical protein